MPQAADIVLSVRGVCKSYGSLPALEDVDIDLRLGEFLVVLGLNGAGKSTLLQLLTALFAPDSGTIVVVGKDLGRQSTEALRDIGVVFQQPTLDLELSVRANLLFHADLHGIRRREARQRVADALARFGLADRAGDKARTLSGGSRRRVELARALLHHPKVLLMDEATVGLDPVSRRDILQHIRHLCGEQQLGVIWATHLIDEAEQADRIVILDKGKVRFAGPPQRLTESAGLGTIEAAFRSLTGQPP